MADQSTRITHPIEVESASKEHVALKLAEKIAYYENDKEQKGRKYWLTLYRQCWKATHGGALSSVLEEK